MSEILYELINNESTPFLAIERLLNSQSITYRKISKYLALRKDAPQYILEWMSMTVTDSRCLRSIFSDHVFVLRSSQDTNNRYGWLYLSERIHLYRELSEQLMSLAKAYIKILNQK